MQIGSSAVRYLAVAALLLVPGLLWPLWFPIAASPGGGIVLLLPFALAAAAISALKTGVRRRATDLVITGRSLRIEGGRLHGFELEGQEIRAELWKLRPRGKATELVMDLPGVDDVVFAESSDQRELASLQAIVATVQATFSARTATTAEPAGDERVLRCAGCGHEVTPTDSAAAMCAFCGASVPIPADVRERIAAAARRRTAHAGNVALVHRLLRQPGAGATNRLLAAAGALMLAAWPATIALCIVLLEEHRLTAGLAALLFALPAPLVLGVVLVALWRLADRQALQLVTLDLGARPPAADGEPQRCRACGAPLPDAGDEVLVECAYCSAHNVLGLDLRPAARAEREQTVTLERALAERQKRRTTSASYAVVGVVVLALVGDVLIGTGRTAATAAPAPIASGIRVCLRRYESYSCAPSRLSPPISGTALREAVIHAPGYAPDGGLLRVRSIPAGHSPESDDQGVYLDDTRTYTAYIVEDAGTRSVYVDEIDDR